ncbi:DUF3987 domain-containing protein [Saccharopolyspora spinosporotrichia]
MGLGDGPDAPRGQHPLGDAARGLGRRQPVHPRRQRPHRARRPRRHPDPSPPASSRPSCRRRTWPEAPTTVPPRLRRPNPVPPSRHRRRPALIERLAVDLRARLDQGATLGQLGFSDEAAYLWRRLYVEFGGFSTEDGPIEQFLSRAAPNCLRVAGIHAALDGTAIQPPHLVAAAAFIRYAVDSARAVFRKADPVLAQLAAFIREAGPQGRTRTEITSDFFQGNAKSPASTRCWNGSSPTRRSPGPSGARRAEGRTRHRHRHRARTLRTYEQCP